MIEVALAALLFFVVAVLVAMRQQQQELTRLKLYTSRPAAADIPYRTPRRQLSPTEQRILRQADDCELLMRRIFMRKCYSRTHMVSQHGYSEYRWNRSMKILRHLGIFGDDTTNVKYGESRCRLRAYFDEQVELARRSDHYVGPI